MDTGKPAPENLWIQFSFPDPDNAAVLQTAETEREARQDDGLVCAGAPWYRYDVEGEANLVNEDGPHYFRN